MIELNSISKAYGAEPLFENVSFTIAPGDRLGLWGRNGSGKTTLFRLLLGEEQPDAGQLRIPSGYRLGCLSQHVTFKEQTVLEEAARDMPCDEHGIRRLHEAEALLQGLGFPQSDFNRSPDLLAGGYQVRLQLARLLLAEPNLLLLDEPTNHLDVVSLRWIAGFLRAWRGELLLISHDREFMDSVTTHTVGIHRQKVRKIPGSSIDLERLIDQEETLQEQTRLNQERRVAQTQRFIDRFRAKNTKAKAVQSRIKQLERMQRIEQLTEVEELSFNFAYTPFQGKWPIQIENLSFGYGPDQMLLQDLSLSVQHGDRIAIIGKNGRGKTTLLRLLAGELAPTGGTVRLSPNAALGYFGQTNIERLDLRKTVEEEILSAQPLNSRSRVRGICGLMMFSGDNALKKVDVLSGGERSRVLLGKLLAAPSNVLLLDEPTNHLDMTSTEALVEAADNFPGTVLVVTHSEMILRALAERLIVFDAGKCFLFEGGYDEFLERVGWQDESAGRDKGDGDSEPSANNRRELRRRRAEFAAKKAEVLRPLERNVASLETEIVRLEEQLKQDEAALLEIAGGAYRSEAAALARSVQQARIRIDALFEDLESASKRLEEEQRRFELEEQRK